MDKEGVVNVCNGILLNHKKNLKFPFMVTWVDLEGIMLSEISQRKTSPELYYLYVRFK